MSAKNYKKKSLDIEGCNACVYVESCYDTRPCDYFCAAVDPAVADEDFIESQRDAFREAWWPYMFQMDGNYHSFAESGWGDSAAYQ